MRVSEGSGPFIWKTWVYPPMWSPLNLVSQLSQRGGCGMRGPGINTTSLHQASVEHLLPPDPILALATQM